MNQKYFGLNPTNDFLGFLKGCFGFSIGLAIHVHHLM